MKTQNINCATHMWMCLCLTSAGVWVMCFSWSPGQIMIEIFAALTVKAHSVMLTHTAPMNLINHKKA